MKSYYREEFLSNLKNKTLFFDTNVLIALVSSIELQSELFRFLQGISLLTIPSAAFEFSRTDTVLNSTKRTQFLKKYFTIYPIERHLDQLEDITVVLQKINGKMSYTDFLLYCCLYKFKDAYLLTENHKDFTTTVLDRKEIITIDGDKETIRNLAFYQFSQEKYERAAASILKTLE